MLSSKQVFATWLLLKIRFSVGFANLCAKCDVATSHCNSANVGVQLIYLPHSISFSVLCMRSVCCDLPLQWCEHRPTTHLPPIINHGPVNGSFFFHKPTSRSWSVA
ncbi:hypothetical protein V8B55DRAFT_1556679 [Mucor lusitanicus]